MIRLFDIHNGKVVPSEHCYTLKFLKDIMDEYGDESVKVYSYLFYMTCPNPDLNPFFDIPETDKEDVILTEVDGDFTGDTYFPELTEQWKEINREEKEGYRFIDLIYNP